MLVNMRSVMKEDICGANIGAARKGEDSKVNFAVCGADPQACSTSTHMSDIVPKIKFPPNQEALMVICLRAKTPQSQPSVFS